MQVIDLDVENVISFCLDLAYPEAMYMPFWTMKKLFRNRNCSFDGSHILHIMVEII